MRRSPEGGARTPRSDGAGWRPPRAGGAAPPAHRRRTAPQPRSTGRRSRPAPRSPPTRRRPASSLVGALLVEDVRRRETDAGRGLPASDARKDLFRLGSLGEADHLVAEVLLHRPPAASRPRRELCPGGLG